MPKLILVRGDWRVAGEALGSVTLVQSSKRINNQALIELARGADILNPPADGVNGYELQPGEEVGASALQAYTGHTSGMLFARAVASGYPGNPVGLLIISPDAQAPAYIVFPKAGCANQDLAAVLSIVGNMVTAAGMGEAEAQALRGVLAIAGNTNVGVGLGEADAQALAGVLSIAGDTYVTISIAMDPPETEALAGVLSIAGDMTTAAGMGAGAAEAMAATLAITGDLAKLLSTP